MPNLCSFPTRVCIRDAKEAFSVYPRFPDRFQYMVLDVEDNEEQNLIRLFPGYVPSPPRNRTCLTVHGPAAPQMYTHRFRSYPVLKPSFTRPSLQVVEFLFTAMVQPHPDREATMIHLISLYFLAKAASASLQLLQSCLSCSISSFHGKMRCSMSRIGDIVSRQMVVS